VFDFIRCANDKAKLKELVGCEPYYQHMDEDPFDLTVNYAHVNGLDMTMETYKNEEGGLNMCKAIEEMIADGRDEGRMEAQERINRLNILLIEQGREADLLKAAKHVSYQEKLLKEFGI
jgi:hypothetical protein